MDELLTTRQLQDLLQVDRVTIYRMLADGRLRGFKVGGQWRFPRRQIEAWLQGQPSGADLLNIPFAGAEVTAPAWRILSLSCVEAIQAICADALDVTCVTTDLNGAPLVAVSNSCAFCSLVLSTERGRDGCSAAWRRPDNGRMHPCHAGLLCTSAAVEVNDQRVAFSAACQFTTPAPDGSQAWQAAIPRLAAELGLAEDALWASAGSVRLLTAEQARRVSAVVHRAASTFAQIGQERQSLLRRLHHIAEISKI